MATLGILIFLLVLGILLRIKYLYSFKTIDKPKEIKKPDNISMILQHYQILDNRLNQRTNFFILAESMMLLSFISTFLINEINIDGFKIFISVVGIIITISLFFINKRLGIQISKLQKKYLFAYDPIFWDYTKSVRPWPTAAIFVSDILPGSVFIL